MEFRTAYDGKQKYWSDVTGVANDEPSCVKPEFQRESDINEILARYERTGELPVNAGAAVQGDFTDAGDFHSSMIRVCEAQEAFDALPAKIRKRFNNDPAELIAFVSDPANESEAVKLGLAKPKVSPGGPGASGGAVSTPDKTSTTPLPATTTPQAE